MKNVTFDTNTFKILNVNDDRVDDEEKIVRDNRDSAYLIVDI